MPIDPKGSAGPSSRRCSLRERLALERKMLHCLALPGREFAEGQIEYLGMVGFECCLLGIPARISAILISEWLMISRVRVRPSRRSPSIARRWAMVLSQAVNERLGS